MPGAPSSFLLLLVRHLLLGAMHLFLVANIGHRQFDIRPGHFAFDRTSPFRTLLSARLMHWPAAHLSSPRQ